MASLETMVDVGKVETLVGVVDNTSRDALDLPGDVGVLASEVVTGGFRAPWTVVLAVRLDKLESVSRAGDVEPMPDPTPVDGVVAKSDE